MSTEQISKFDLELEQAILKKGDGHEEFSFLFVSNLFPLDWLIAERIQFLERMVNEEKLHFHHYHGKTNSLNSYRV